ncbi:P-type conjugative transfer protein TrbG [Sphingomonas crusticola]|uniref:P-type conjugative transfer protein TrbG n=1 Tax=Sphingomonas crusticola TaxID=1697973 RepID=UPI000E22D29C|nr:P-type conjugative transfer protein TrbG [Sphingomonas crusticola]
MTPLSSWSAFAAAAFVALPAFAADPAKRQPMAAAATVERANRTATIAPTGAAFVNANQVYPFADGAIYQVLTAPERITDIELQPGEALGAVASGDTARWLIGDTTSGSGEGKRSHVLVKPFAPNLRTNLIITTDRRTYHLTLASTRGASMSALSWTYPAEGLLALHKAQAERDQAQPIAPGISPDQLNFNYAVTGPATAWRPLRAFDDGRQTFIEFPPALGAGEAPPLFLLDHGGVQLVNYRVSGHYYIVDRLFETAELRIGGKDATTVRITKQAVGKGGRPS